MTATRSALSNIRKLNVDRIELRRSLGRFLGISPDKRRWKPLMHRLRA